MDSTQLGLEIAKVVATLVASSVAAWVAYSIGSSQRDIAKQQAEIAAEQKRIAAAKLNLELFEQRYAMFYKVWGFLSETFHTENEELISFDFTNEIPKAQFLFGQEIADYMREAEKKRGKLAMLHRKLVVTGNSSDEDTKQTTELGIWFYQEAGNCFERFAPYLDFSAWKA